MQKLISKNPIQRFKEGKKIIKAERGNQFIYYTRRDGINYEAWRGGDDWYYRQKGGTGMTRMPYDYETTTGQRFYSSTPRGVIANTYDVVNNMSKTSKATPTRTKIVVFPEEVDPNYTHNFLEALRAGYRPNPDGTWKAPDNVASVSSTEENTSTSVNNNKTAQPAGSVTTSNKNRVSFKSAFNQARNSGLQEFTWNGKRYNTMKAGESKEQWLSGLKGQQVPQLNQVAPITSVSTFAAPKFDQQPVITNAPKPTYNFNRSQTRQLMRNAGYNPYDFTGAQRKALRLYLNGQSNDISQLEGIDLNKFKFKNGGRLIPRNPVKRFKLKNNI